MNRKLLAGVAALGLLAGGGGAAALAVAAPAAATGTVAAASTIAAVPAYGPLGSLVAKGTITQAQATAIHNALISYMRSHWRDMRRDCTGPGTDHTPWVLERGGPLESVLGQLVGNGTITKTQASAVTSAYTQWVNTHHGTGPHGNGRFGGRGGMMAGAGNGMMGGWATR